jgi:subtilisin family serine protease
MAQRTIFMDRLTHGFWRRRIPIWNGVRSACLCFALLTSPVARAQLGLPSLPTVPAAPAVQLPQLPAATSTVTRQLDAIVADTASELDSQNQRLLRAARVRALLRANPDTLEADPNGAPVRRSQVVSLSPTPQSLQAATAAGFTVVEDQSMDELGVRMVTLQAPPGMTTRRALQRLRALDRGGTYDYNHVYTQSAAGDMTGASSVTSTTAATSMAVHSDTRVGLIDGGVETMHPVFHGNSIHTWGCDRQAKPNAHGTAVASLLVGQSERFNGAAPGATLYAADVYCGQPVGGAMTRIAGAMAWLAQQQVPVINISLVGPDNLLLKQLVRNLIARGYIIVAAVGNDGPAAPPLYPASYPGVVGVTAVDTRDRVLVEAGRGKQVRFAAPGADMAAAALQGQYVSVRGTSFAAPLVAGLLATHISTPQPDAAKAALAAMASSARDLGSRGPDRTYGYGVVGDSLRVALAGLSAGSDNMTGSVAHGDVEHH